MQNMYQTIFVFFVAFYFVYITLAIAAFWSSLKSTRKKSLKLRKLISVRELGQITVIPEVQYSLQHLLTMSRLRI